MKIIMIVAALSFVSGSGPWCGADEAGNLYCYFWSYSACQSSGYAACVANPRQ